MKSLMLWRLSLATARERLDELRAIKAQGAGNNPRARLEELRAIKAQSVNQQSNTITDNPIVQGLAEFGSAIQRGG